MDSAAIILARSASSRFPNKNLSPLGGKPLLQWAIETARNSGEIDEVYVSTDSEQYAEVAFANGATFIPRPPHLALDSSSSESGVLHALDFIRYQWTFDPKYACLIQVTSPLTRLETVRDAMRAVKGEFDTAVSVRAAHKKPWWSFVRNAKKHLVPFINLPASPFTSEQPPPTYYPTGGVYAFKTDYFRRSGSFHGGICQGVECEWYEDIDIDYPEDLAMAEYALKLIGREKNGLS